MLALASAGVSAMASEPPASERNVDGIQDNSFFVEEAYNQEKGVVQHILTAFYGFTPRSGPDDQIWNLNFTQEWPLFSQTHQFSYSIPYHFVQSAGENENSLGDMLINYRFQAYYNEQNLMAFAPRASIVLPTGDPDRGVGDDTVGCQFNLPFSTAIGSEWFVHLNTGLTYLPSAASAQDRDLISYNVGGSVIFAATRDTHFLVEWLGFWTQFGEAGQPRDREFASVISPGARHAFNFANGSQLVVGAAVPVGLSGSWPDVGAFLYVSFEHFLSGKE